MRIAVALSGWVAIALLAWVRPGVRQCTCSPSGILRAPQTTGALVEVDATPPPARVEQIPAPPSRSAVWLDGEWTWRRGGGAWTPGRWVEGPRAAAFSPWVFERGPDGRLWYAPGLWRDDKGTPIAPPPALAAATVQFGAVVSAEGIPETTGPTVRPRSAPSAVPPESPARPKHD